MSRNYRDYTPASLLERLVGLCLGVFLAAMALYGAVWLVREIWLPLCIGLAVVGVVALLSWAVCTYFRRY